MERLERVRQAISAHGRHSWETHDIVSPFPKQRPKFYYPGLDTRTVHDTSQFEWTARLESAFPEIRQELDDVLTQRSGFVRVFEEDTGEGDWAAFLLNIYGVPVEANLARFPNTMAVLNTIPGLCGFICVSAISPFTHVLPHYGVSNARLRCHLPLKVPKGCRLRIGDDVFDWVEGQAILFDDSFEHEAWNPTPEPRFILLFDILHPNLTEEERQFLLELQSRARTGVYGGRLPDEPAGDWVYR